MSKKIYIGDQEIGTGSSGGGSFDPTDINSSISDISTRVNAIETDYVVSNDLSAFLTDNDVSNYITDNDISTFVTQSALDSSYISLESSIIALDASALAFDASIKELASAGGGGGGDAAFVKYTNTSDSTKVGIVSSLRTAAPCTSIGQGAVILYNGIATNTGAFSSGDGVANGINAVALGIGTVKTRGSFATVGGTCGAQYAAAIGVEATANGVYSIALGQKCQALSTNAYAEGYSSKAQSNVTGVDYMKTCHAEGLCTQSTGGYGSHSEGYYSSATGNGSHAEGMSYAHGNYSHTEGNNVYAYNQAEHGEGIYNKCSSTGGSTFGSPLNTLSTIGNGNYANKHNAFEVRQSGDIYIPDVSATGEYYEKPMINLQQKIYELEARIATLESQLPSA